MNIKIESKCLIARNAHETDVIFIGIDSAVLIYILIYILY